MDSSRALATVSDLALGFTAAEVLFDDGVCIFYKKSDPECRKKRGGEGRGGVERVGEGMEHKLSMSLSVCCSVKSLSIWD